MLSKNKEEKVEAFSLTKIGVSQKDNFEQNSV